MGGSSLAPVAFAIVVVLGISAMAYVDVSQKPVQSSTSLALSATSTVQYLTSTSSIDEYPVTANPCGSPGVFYCGPSLIANASLTSASTIGGNYSLLNLTVSGNIALLQVSALRVFLSNASSGDQVTPLDPNHALWQVAEINPSWNIKNVGTYSFEVPTSLHFVKGAQCDVWVDAVSVISSTEDDQWAMQNMTVG